jgi:hypothetical protein
MIELSELSPLNDSFGVIISSFLINPPDVSYLTSFVISDRPGIDETIDESDQKREEANKD